MSDITQSVIHLRSQNTQALISMLFDELLESIFLILVPSWSSVGYYFGRIDQLARAISQVCSRWRQLSLRLPNLWKSIELGYGTLPWKEELLRRSMNAPFIEIQSPDDECFDEFLDINIPNILFNGGLSAKGWVQLFNSAQQPGVQLERLFIDSTSEALEQTTELMFHGHAPPLHDMWMGKTDHVNLTLPFFSNLRSMNIIQPELSISNLASIVANIPYLKRLDMVTELIIDDLRSRLIFFPHLRHFSYTDQNFPKYIDMPLECLLRTTCDWSNRTEAVRNIIPRLIYDHTNTGNPWLGINIYKGHFMINNIKTFDWSTTGDELRINALGGKRVQQRWRILLQELMPRLTAILSTVTRLKFESRAEKGSDGNLVFPCLKQLYDDGSGPRMLFPSLKTVYLRQNYRWQGNTAAEFESYLAWRIEQGAPIESIEGQYLNDARYNFEREWGSFGSELENRYGIRVNVEPLAFGS